MLQIALGEVVFGGVGCGLYGMIGFAILTVFIAGLMVVRTPEFLGKKIEPTEMRWAVVLCLATPFAILVTPLSPAWCPVLLTNSTTAGRMASPRSCTPLLRLVAITAPHSPA